MRILLMGDFGSGADVTVPLAQRPVRRVDLDTFDAVLSGVAPQVSLTQGGEPVTLRFGALDDFHPDRLFDASGAFASLQERAAPPATPVSAPASAPDGGDFASLLGGAVGQRAAQGPGSAADQLVRRLLGSTAAPAAAQPGATGTAAFDAAATLRMRAILHDPAFQAVEAQWRGLWELVTGLELDDDLQLWILDVRRDELLADAAQGTPALARLLLDEPLRGADPAPWTLLCGAMAFSADAADVKLLDTLGRLAAQAGAPFVASAHDSLAGVSSLAAAPDPDDWQPLETGAGAAWEALRQAPHAQSLGLALPRVLLRLPYGRATDPVERFAFEEAGPDFGHGDYLWGHASLACALLLGRAFRAEGWDMDPDSESDLDGLPAHTMRRDGEAVLQACAETVLSERAAAVLLERGLMPLLSFRNRNAARLARSQSLSQPTRPLAGAWNR
jgi:type VI secretion system protein ImpC